MTSEKEKDLGRRFDIDDLDALVENIRGYLDSRRRELERPLTSGVYLDTWDPFLNGYSTGMRAGLEMASGLVGSYREWMRRGVFHPEPW